MFRQSDGDGDGDGYGDRDRDRLGTSRVQAAADEIPADEHKFKQEP